MNADKVTRDATKRNTDTACHCFFTAQQQLHFAVGRARSEYGVMWGQSAEANLECLVLLLKYATKRLAEFPDDQLVFVHKRLVEGFVAELQNLIPWQVSMKSEVSK